jgi:hypothetical protein
MWTTPDEANLDSTGGGLVVYKARYPEGWSWYEHNSYTDNKVWCALPHHQVKQEAGTGVPWWSDGVPCRQENIDALIEADGRRHVRVPYKANRMLIFKSDLFHFSDEFQVLPLSADLAERYFFIVRGT